MFYVCALSFSRSFDPVVSSQWEFSDNGLSFVVTVFYSSGSFDNFHTNVVSE